MKLNLYPYCTLIALFLSINSAFAQTDSCIQAFREGSQLFEQNEFDESIRVLSQVLRRCKFEKEEEIQARKLLILNYLSVDEIENAEKMTMEIMKLDPKYKPDVSRDDARLSELFSKFKSTPIFRAGVVAGFNRSLISIRQYHSIVHEFPDESIGSYKAGMGLNFGFGGEYRLRPDWWISGSAFFQSSSYEHQLFDVENLTIKYEESLNYFSVPLLLKREFHAGSLRPYLGVGPVVSYMSKALSTSSRDNFKDLSNRLNLRNRFNFGALGNVGISLEKGATTYSMAFAFQWNYRDTDKADTRYSDPLNVYRYYYIDDDFKLNYMMLNFSVVQNLAYRNIRSQ